MNIRLFIVSSHNLNIIQTINTFHKFRVTNGRVRRKSWRNKMRWREINAFANICQVCDRLAVNSAGPRNAHIEISISAKLPAWPVQAEISAAEGVRNRSAGSCRCTTPRSHAGYYRSSRIVAGPNVPVMLSRLQTLISQSNTL